MEKKGQSGFDSQRYPIICRNSEFSNQKLAELETLIRDSCEKHNINDPKISLVVFGSLARKEAYQSSDVDFCVITDGGSENEAERLRSLALNAIDDVNLDKPNSKGIFDSVVSYDELTAHVGSRNDSYDILACRLLLLLEAKPVWGKASFQNIREKLITFYENDVAKDSSKNHVFLLNDLVRYFRTICVNYAYSKRKNTEKWAIRNVKLRHSRVVMYTSMIIALGTISKSVDKPTDLRSWIDQTPLERFQQAYTAAGDPSFYKIAGFYNTYMNLMSDVATREALLGLKYEDRYHSPSFSMLKSNSDALSSEITRFILARRGDWSDRFIEYLLI